MKNNQTNQPRFAFQLILSVATVVGFILSGQSTAQECDANCLRVFNIQMYDYLAADAQANVTVINDSGTLAFGAVVQGIWTRPDHTTFDQYDVIGVSGRAEFRLYSDQSGIATLTVAGISLPGDPTATLDPLGSNVLSGSIQIGNPSLLGDINRDGAIDLLDVAPFVELISNGLYQFEADANEDGELDLLDVSGFVELLAQ